MKKKLIDLINNGWDVKFSNQIKRMDGEFVIRTCWKAEYKDERYDCAWAGFDDAKPCIEDFIKIANITMENESKPKPKVS
jgi:hypothetical protein